MRKVEENELRQIQIQILNQVSAYCERENICYWLDCGTLLGAIRHKGFIPWDDDIDIGMLREDYDRFVTAFNQSNARYQCCTKENTDGFPIAFAKIMDVNTELYEPSKKGGIKMCINIDVFPYDNAPSEEQLSNRMYDKSEKYISWYKRSIICRWSIDKRVKSIARYIVYMILKIVPRQYWVNKINDTIMKYKDVETGYVGNFTSVSRILCKKEVFNSFIDVEFEGQKYKAPVGYDAWLKAFYGDYMKLPPEDQRVSKHRFEAYVCD